MAVGAPLTPVTYRPVTGSTPAGHQIEDDDLYAFVQASSVQFAVPLVVVADGRTPWQMFEDKQIIGNTA